MSSTACSVQPVQLARRRDAKRTKSCLRTLRGGLHRRLASGLSPVRPLYGPNLTGQRPAAPGFSRGTILCTASADTDDQRDTSQRKIAQTLSALDLVLDTAAKEAAAAAEAAELAAKEEAERPPDKRKEFAAADAQVNTQLAMSTFLSYRPLAPDWMFEDPKWVPQANLLPEKSSESSSSNEGAEEGREPALPAVRPPHVMSSEDHFMLPLVNTSTPMVPGQYMVMNLFEPRWVTLFGKLLADDPDKVSLLRDQGGNVALNIEEEASMLVYEMPLSNNASTAAETDLGMAVVPGFGRFDESSFIGTKRFGTVYRENKEKTSQVGTIMEVVATDVVEIGPSGKTRRARAGAERTGIPVVVVIARGVRRFRVKEVVQEEPYTVVEACDWSETETDSLAVRKSD
eukprot:CAMPEP_0197847562 /NCGR_PEP_ID=MMETSP1438-20131217/6411_1 /TAXON_ID=1461541 /ORGANISM="Pterosperma sp., Strain CCMP1384" /LENGTH=400 /DNA_ID=CAMNT_0043459513 /DNA_START=203 /DNA_END=1402 /DNA_ORIENTATION=+